MRSSKECYQFTEERCSMDSSRRAGKPWRICSLRLVVAIALSIAPAAAAQEEAAPRVAALVRDLGADAYAVRVDAEAELAAMGAEAESQP